VGELMREAAAQQSPFWLIFAPLARDADRYNITLVVRKLREQTSPREFEELAAAMVVLAEVNQRAPGLRDVITSVLPRELTMQNWFYREGLKEGLEKGLEKGQQKPLVYQFERRLGRPLTRAERQRLTERLREQGAKRVADVVLDLSPQKLLAWLTAKNGH
jgi:flagellar biosynthesis/type III secretory pathway protein FliH